MIIDWLLWKKEESKTKPRSPAGGKRRLVEKIMKIVNQVEEQFGEASELGLRY